MNALRDKFELFQRARKNRGGAKRATMFARLPDDTYADPSVQRHWWTWQNALEARASQAPQPCDMCGGTGELFIHADDCDDDLCALNGDMHSCVGQVVRCECQPHSLQPEAAEPVPAPVQPVRAWAHEDDDERVISAVQKGQALRDGGASAASVRPYSVPLYATPPVESVERDAARYRWLRDVGDATWRPFGIREGYSAAEADAAIDAALAGHKEQQP